MNMATDGKFTGAREINLNGLARRLLARIECHTGGIHIDLMEKFVLVRKKNAVAGTERDLVARALPRLLAPFQLSLLRRRSDSLDLNQHSIADDCGSYVKSVLRNARGRNLRFPSCRPIPGFKSQSAIQSMMW